MCDSVEFWTDLGKSLAMFCVEECSKVYVSYVDNMAEIYM